MKRVNIHLDENCLSELDKIAKKIKGDSLLWNTTNRADLIRYSIFKTFGISICDTHYSFGRIEKNLDRIIKKCR